MPVNLALTETRLTQLQRKERTRMLLTRAAGEVFIKHGFNGASIDLIAESAGYTKGAVYFHFKNKEELLYGVMKHRSNLIFDSIENTKPHNDPLTSLLDESVQKELIGDWFDRDSWVILQLEYLLFLQRNPKAKKEFKKLIDVDRKKLVSLIERKYLEAGRKPPLDPLEIAQIQEIVDIGFGVSRLIDPDIPQSIYEKLISVAR